MDVFFLDIPLVAEIDIDPFIEESELTEAFGEDIVIKFGHFHHFVIRDESHFSPALGRFSWIRKGSPVCRGKTPSHGCCRFCKLQR